jgi:uncharacterized protein
MIVEQAYISKANVCPYFGRDIPGAKELGLDPDKVYHLLRAPEELARAADSASNLPLLEHHTAITASAPSRELWVGTTGKVTFEHPYLVSRPMKVWTQHAIDLIESKKQRELSSGYGYTPDMSPGMWEGQRYDGIMRNLHFNHVAIVSEGRVGPDVMVPDELPPELSMTRRASATTIAAALATLAAAGMSAEQVTLAMDKKAKDDADRDREEELDREEAMDSREAGCDEREESMDAAEEMSDKDKDDDVAKDRKKARDSRRGARDSRKGARDKRAHDRKGAKDGEPDPRKDFDTPKGKDNAITQDEVDAAIKAASDAATKRATALFEAREAVKPVCGVVALDSEADVYSFALKQLGVDTAGVHPSALRKLFEVSHKAAAATAKTADIAMDAASKGFSVRDIWKLQAEAA